MPAADGFMSARRPMPLPLPARRAVAVGLTGVLLCLPFAPVHGEWAVLGDPEVAALSADALVAGAPVPHPRLLLSGACVDHDSDATARWTRVDKRGHSHRGYSSVALLRRASDGQSTGWFVHTPITTATGCEARAFALSRAAIDQQTLEAARAVGLSPDPDRILGPNWIEPSTAALRLLVSLWAGGSLAAFMLQVAWGPPSPTPTSRQVLRWIYLSIALSGVAWAVVWAGAACADG